MDTPPEIGLDHRQTWDLIPWIINNTANPQERRLAQAHLQTCEDCRAELAYQQHMHDGMRLELAEARDPAPGLQRLWERVDAEAAPLPHGMQEAANQPVAPATSALPQPPRRAKGNWLMRGLVAAVIIEAVGLALLGARPWERADSMGQAGYQTLTQSPATAAASTTLRLVLASDMRVGELQALLQANALQIVGGPSEAGVYSLAPLGNPQAASASLPAQLARLRATPGVRFAEPVASAQ